MLTKAKILKNQFEDIIDDVCAKHQCSNQMAELRMHISKIQRYEHIFEQSTITPIKLLKSLKKDAKNLRNISSFKSLQVIHDG